jgi:MFS transporter, FSR family, fosmidomycin resistance protein
MNKDAATISLVAGAHAVSHFFQLVLAPLFPLMSSGLHVSYSTLGVVMMVFFAVSAVLQPFAGFLVDRIGGRGVLLAGVSLMTLGALIMSLAGGAPLLALGAMVMGIGNSVFHPADFSILNGRVSQPKLGYAFSAHGVAGQLGFAAAPVFSAAVAAAYGWQAALLSAAAVGAAVLIMLLANSHLLHAAQVPQRRQRIAQDARVLLSFPVLVCFAFFVIWGASYVGLSSFGIAAMQMQFGLSTALAASAITAYMLGNASGMLAGGVVAARVPRHDLIAVGGLLVAALFVLPIAAGAVSGAALPVVLALTGFFAGVTYPSRDLIVRSATPPGAAGRVYGFVYSGLDVGSLAMPVFYGMLIDHGLPQGVFYVIFGCMLVAVATVLQLARKPSTASLNIAGDSK